MINRCKRCIKYYMLLLLSKWQQGCEVFEKRSVTYIAHNSYLLWWPVFFNCSLICTNLVWIIWWDRISRARANLQYPSSWGISRRSIEWDKFHPLWRQPLRSYYLPDIWERAHMKTMESESLDCSLVCTWHWIPSPSKGSYRVLLKYVASRTRPRND